MLEAAEPLPTPTGSGPVALLVGGSYGTMRMVALDAQGRVLAYGPGEGEAYALAVCPVPSVWSKASSSRPTKAAYSIEVRDLRTMAVVAKLAPGLPWARAPARPPALPRPAGRGGGRVRAISARLAPTAC